MLYQIFLSLLRRQGIKEAPIDFQLCPSLYETFKKKNGATDYDKYFEFPMRGVGDLSFIKVEKNKFNKYYKYDLKPGTHIDVFGVAHEPGSDAAKHMTRMRHPLSGIDSIEQLKEYPFPDFNQADGSYQKIQVEEIENLCLNGLWDNLYKV